MNGGERLHLQHGPIDLIIEATGDRDAVVEAYRQACETFQTVLKDLVVELEDLRKPLLVASASPKGAIAQRMINACLPYTNNAVSTPILTPMIAVAGAVADHVLQAMHQIAKLRRIYVNNGGDIALWLAPSETFTVGICEDVHTGRIGSRISLDAWQAVQGVATSGWRGRSHSLGIADAVTVLAGCAAEADVAATVIANAVDVQDSECVQRVPACELSPDSDLLDTPVTVSVSALDPQQIDVALEQGRQRAVQLLTANLIDAAYISVQGRSRICQNTGRLTTGHSIPLGAMNA